MGSAIVRQPTDQATDGAAQGLGDRTLQKLR